VIRNTYEMYSVQQRPRLKIGETRSFLTDTLNFRLPTDSSKFLTGLGREVMGAQIFNFAAKFFHYQVFTARNVAFLNENF